MTIHAQTSDYHHHVPYQVDAPAISTAEMTQAKWKAWTNFKHVIVGGGVAAILALGALWWITY